MAGIPYVGRNPDTDPALTPRSYQDSAYTSGAVTTGFVNTVIASETATLATPAYVNTGDGTRAKQTDVTTADNTYLATTVLNQANGIAGLDFAGNAFNSQLTGLRTDRTPLVYSCYDSGIGTIYLSGSRTVTTTTLREYRIASLEIPDPGYPWSPLVFAVVAGGATTSAAPASRATGTGNYGLITVMGEAEDTRLYTTAVGTASNKVGFLYGIPYGNLNAQPFSINGAKQLNLYCCMWSGSTGYTFQSAGLVFYTVVVPSMTP